MRSFKKVLASIATLLIFSIAGVGQASADQTINIDLNNFQNDGTIRDPNYNISGASDGDILTINVSNSSQGFLAYINNGAGNSINVNNGASLNLTNNTGQFFGAGNLSSLMVNSAIVGSYTATITLGANALLDRTIANELSIANDTSSPSNAVGWLLLDWRSGGANSANWKLVSILSNGTPRSSSATVVRTGNALRVDSAGTTTEKNNVVSCTPGKYTFLNGGSTAETAKIQSYVYTLLVNGKAVSTLSSDNFRSVASHMFPTIAGNMAGTATLEGATWDLKGMSNYSAQCQVYATQSGGNVQSVTTAVHDSVALAAAAEAAANVAKNKEIIAAWNASSEELAKKYRDQRLVGKP